MIQKSRDCSNSGVACVVALNELSFPSITANACVVYTEGKALTAFLLKVVFQSISSHGIRIKTSLNKDVDRTCLVVTTENCRVEILKIRTNYPKLSHHRKTLCAT